MSFCSLWLVRPEESQGFSLFLSAHPGGWACDWAVKSRHPASRQHFPAPPPLLVGRESLLHFLSLQTPMECGRAALAGKVFNPAEPAVISYLTLPLRTLGSLAPEAPNGKTNS